MLKFLLGDMVELSVIGVAQLAGAQITDNNKDLFITGRDGTQVPVHPDGLLWTGSQYWNVEIKSCDSRTYDRWSKQGGPDDTWGYLTQVAVEEQAWKEHGIMVEGTCFIAVSTGTRQGNVAEYILHGDEALLNGWHDRRALARGEKVPAIPFEMEVEKTTVRGKAIDAAHFFYGDPTPLHDKNGKLYGHEVMTGRKKLPVVCGYCAYRDHDFPGVQFDDKEKVWIVPATLSASEKSSD
jgi:hypothetical protein